MHHDARIRRRETGSQIGEHLLRALSVATCSTAVACSVANAAELMDDQSTVAERGEAGTAYWNVNADGDARLVVTDDKGNVLKQGVAGQLTFKADGAGAGKAVNLELDDETGVLRADGPDLDAPMTEVRYSLLVNGKPRSGALHLPESGTKGLREVADEDDDGKAKGPHGGSIEKIDDHRYEVVADSVSGEVRVYPLDDGERPKKVKLALDSDRPSVVELSWHAEGYFVAAVEIERPPRKSTLVIVDDDEDTHVVLVGYRPGVVLVVNAHPVYWAHRSWGHPGLARGHYKGTVHGPPGHYDGHDHDYHHHDHGPDQVMIKSGKGGSKVKVKIH